MIVVSLFVFSYEIFSTFRFHPKSVKKWAKLEVAPKKEWKIVMSGIEKVTFKPSSVVGEFDLTGDKVKEKITIKGIWEIRKVAKKVKYPGKFYKGPIQHFHIHHLLITDGKSNEILVFYDAKLFPIPFFKECFRKDQITHYSKQIWDAYEGPPESWKYSLPKNLPEVLDDYVPPMWTCFSKFFKFMCEILSYFPNAPKSTKLKLKKLASQNIPNTWPEASKFLKEYEKVLDSLTENTPFKFLKSEFLSDIDCFDLGVDKDSTAIICYYGTLYRKLRHKERRKNWSWRWIVESKEVTQKIVEANRFRDYLKWLPCCNAFVAYSEVREW